MRGRWFVRFAAICAPVLGGAGCRDLSSFSTGSGSYQGQVLQADFIRAGIDPSTSLCMTLDADRLQDAPGSLWTSDGLFQSTPLRPIPQLWNDPLSTLSFGEGRVKNLIYVATPSAPVDGGAADGGTGDVMVVVSLMQSGSVEVRLLRGAPPIGGADAGVADGGADAGATGGSLFAIFDLSRQGSACAPQPGATEGGPTAP